MNFSIIIPFFNRISDVLNGVISLQAQTYPNFTCLLVNDGSSDSIIELESFIANDDRFIILNLTTNLGASNARNIGLDASNGEYLIFMDSDNILLPNALEQRVDVLSHTRYNLLISKQQINSNEGVLRVLNPETVTNPLHSFLRFRVKNSIQWMNEALTINRNFLLKNNIRWLDSLPCYQDLQFNIDLWLKQPNYKILNDIDCIYNASGGERINNKLNVPENIHEYYNFLLGKKTFFLNLNDKIYNSYLRTLNSLYLLMLQLNYKNVPNAIGQQKFLFYYHNRFYTSKELSSIDKFLLFLSSKLIYYRFLPK